MNIDQIEHKLTIQEAASVYAQIKINDLKSQQEKLNREIMDLSLKAQSEIEKRVQQIFKRSKYFEAYNLLFGSKPYHIYFETIDQKVSNDYKISIEKYPLFYLNNIKSEGIYTLYLKFADHQTSDMIFLELDERLHTSTILNPRINSMTEHLKEIDEDLSKNWEKIYTNHFIAKKMADMGFNETISIPDLPKIELNSNLLGN